MRASTMPGVTPMDGSQSAGVGTALRSFGGRVRSGYSGRMPMDLAKSVISVRKLSSTATATGTFSAARL